MQGVKAFGRWVIVVLHKKRAPAYTGAPLISGPYQKGL